MVRPAGFEPATSCSGGKRSIQLSYGRTVPSPIIAPSTPSVGPAEIFTQEASRPRCDEGSPVSEDRRGDGDQFTSP